MEFRDTDLRNSVGKPSEEDQLIGSQSAFKDGTKVYITLPGGKRMEAIAPVFSTLQAQVNQQVSVMEAILTALESKGVHTRTAGF